MRSHSIPFVFKCGVQSELKTSKASANGNWFLDGRCTIRILGRHVYRILGTCESIIVLVWMHILTMPFQSDHENHLIIWMNEVLEEQN